MNNGSSADAMLMVNGTPVDVGLPAAFRRRSGRREVQDFDRLDDETPDCRALRCIDFVRRRAEPPPPSRPETSVALRRKLREARARLRRRRPGGAGDGVSRAHAQVQCVGMPEPGKRTLAMQTCGTGHGDLKPHCVAAVQTYVEHFTWFRPPVKCKTGVDAGTQLAQGDMTDPEAELFRLTEPMVAGALERAAVFVLFADDGVASRAERAAYEARRRAERVEQYALEYREDSRRQRGQRALAEAKRVDPVPAFRAVHSRALSAAYVAGLCADTVDRLVAAGYLNDDESPPLDGWLHDRLRDHDVQRPADSRRRLMDALIAETIFNRRQPQV